MEEEYTLRDLLKDLRSDFRAMTDEEKEDEYMLLCIDYYNLLD